jgi:hypothetical protein
MTDGTSLPAWLRPLYRYRVALANGHTPSLELQNEMAELEGKYDKWYRDVAVERAHRSREPLHPTKALEWLNDVYMSSDTQIYGVDEISMHAGRVVFRWVDGTESVFEVESLREVPLPPPPVELPAVLILSEDGEFHPNPDVGTAGSLECSQ